MITLVLIHGAWHGPWCWDNVVQSIRNIAERKNKKIDIITPDFSKLRSIEEFRNKLTEFLVDLENNMKNKELILIGHSLGGFYITELWQQLLIRKNLASNNIEIKKLIYITAFILKPNKNIKDCIEQQLNTYNLSDCFEMINDYQDIKLDISKLKEYMYNDCTDHYFNSVKNKLSIQSKDFFGYNMQYLDNKYQELLDQEKLYIICDNDHIISKHDQFKMASESNCKIRYLNSCHSSFFFYPKKLVDLLLDSIF